MKKLIAALLMTLLTSFWACKKSQEPAPAPEKAQTEQEPTAEKRPAKKAKKNQKRARQQKAAADGLELYLNDRMVVAIETEQLSGMMSSSITVEDAEMKALPLADLLTQNEMNGKWIVIRGAKQSCTLDRAKVSGQDLFLYMGPKGKIQLFQKNPKQGARCPVSPLRVTVTDQPPARAAGRAKQNPAKS